MTTRAELPQVVPSGWAEVRPDTPNWSRPTSMLVEPVTDPVPAWPGGGFAPLAAPPPRVGGTPPKVVTTGDGSQPEASAPPPGPAVNPGASGPPPKQGTEDVAGTFNRKSTVFDLQKRPVLAFGIAAGVLGLGGVIGLAVASRKKPMKGGM